MISHSMLACARLISSDAGSSFVSHFGVLLAAFRLVFDPPSPSDWTPALPPGSRWLCIAAEKAASAAVPPALSGRNFRARSAVSKKALTLASSQSNAVADDDAMLAHRCRWASMRSGCAECTVPSTSMDAAVAASPELAVPKGPADRAGEHATQNEIGGAERHSLSLGDSCRPQNTFCIRGPGANHAASCLPTIPCLCSPSKSACQHSIFSSLERI